MNFIDTLYEVERKDASFFTSENEFMRYSIELYKEFFSLFCAIINIEEISKIHVEMRKAIIFGLLRKITDEGGIKWIKITFLPKVI